MKELSVPVPRIMIAGTNSGCGKTTITCALLQALVNRKLSVGAFKCGPDYIDPMFHSKVIGTPSSNLDPYFFDKNTLLNLLVNNGAKRDINIIEGVMGFYDGLSLVSDRASAHELSDLTSSPVILAVNAKGASLSVIATIKGFLDFKANNIVGVILNNCSEMTYKTLAVEIERTLGIRALGFLPKLDGCTIESRHLGLVTADEITDLKAKLALLASQAEKSLDIDGTIELARGAAPVEHERIVVPKKESVLLAVARDRAFCFYYEDSLCLLESMGAKLIPFSPMEDESLPENIDGLYLGGGYPELYLDTLEKNEGMRRSIKAALMNKLPCIAECGGFMYLNKSIAERDMAGFLGGECFDTGKLTRFGYVELTANCDNMLARQGESIRAHEFHHWDCTENGSGFCAVKPNGKKWQCAIVSDTLYAGFPHFNFYSNIDFAINFYNAMLKEKHSHERDKA